MSRNKHDEAERERREMRGANTLGWLVGPAIVVAIVVVASGCGVHDAGNSTAAEAGVRTKTPLQHGLDQPSPQPAGAAAAGTPG